MTTEHKPPLAHSRHDGVPSEYFAYIWSGFDAEVPSAPPGTTVRTNHVTVEVLLEGAAVRARTPAENLAEATRLRDLTGVTRQGGWELQRVIQRWPDAGAPQGTES